MASLRYFIYLTSAANTASDEALAKPAVLENQAEKNVSRVYIVRTHKHLSRHEYGDIACFVYESPYTYLQTIAKEQKLPANEPSLVKVEETTNGIFRKVIREMAIPQYMIAACKRMRDGRLALQLKEPLNCEVKVSKEAASLLRDWILEAVGEINVQG